ncbi:MAG: hypothetical protein VW405_22945 [Rhodospirillaceae bacterium]
MSDRRSSNFWGWPAVLVGFGLLFMVGLIFGESGVNLDPKALVFGPLLIVFGVAIYGSRVRRPTNKE